MEWLNRLLVRLRGEESKPDPSVMMEPRGHHYTFGHIALRQVAAREPLTIFTILCSSSAQEFLDDLWRQVGDRLPPGEKRLSSEGLRFVLHRRQGEFAIAIVALPPPKGVTECYYVAMVAGPLPTEGASVSKEQFKAIPLHNYFTLEYGYPYPKERTTLCSWNEETHNNFGDGPEPDDPENFYNRVCVMLA